MTPTQREERQLRVEHFAAVGAVASAWAKLEILIDLGTASLAGIDAKVAICMTSQIAGPSRKLAAFAALARLKGADKLSKEIEKFTNKTISLSEQRNRIVHDPWYVDDPEKPKRFEASARKKLKLEYIGVKTQDIMALYDKIEEHIDEFVSLQKRINTLISALKDNYS